MLGKKAGIHLNVITHNVINFGQIKTESFVYHWLHAHAIHDESMLSHICLTIICHLKRLVNTLMKHEEPTDAPPSGWWTMISELGSACRRP